MRLLVVSNYYPPYFFGGYELGCRDVVEGLKARGHSVTVLASDFQAKASEGDSKVERALRLKSGRKDLLSLCQNAVVFLRTLWQTRPEVIYFWNQAGLSHWLAPLARGLGYRCVFFISDTSFQSWRVGAFLRRFLTEPDSRKNSSFLLRGYPVIRDCHCQFASRFLLQLAQRHSQPRNATVIHWGIDVELFRPPPEGQPSLSPTRILYVGQIIPEKGVETLVEAVGQLLVAAPKSISLTIVGGSSNPGYLAQLQETVRGERLSESIRFAGKKARPELVELYHAHDLLVLPSIWDEPFAITPLEAMACGLAVVATTTGGSAEIFRDETNSLTFPAGDATACATAIARLQREPELYEHIRQQGMAEVASRFTLQGMIEKIETDLLSVLKS